MGQARPAAWDPIKKYNAIFEAGAFRLEGLLSEVIGMDLTEPWGTLRALVIEKFCRVLNRYPSAGFERRKVCS